MKMISLSGANYHLWKGKMKDLLFVKNLHLPVFASDKPESKSDEEWDFEHQQVCGFIRQFVDDNVYNFIVGETHARSLWEKLESLYASKSGTNKLYLLKNFVELKYKEGTPISDHLSEFQGRFDQLAGVDIKFDEDLLELFLLNSLPDSWETFRVSMISAAPNGDISLQMAKTSALNEEMRKKTQGTSSHSEVFITENRGISQNKEQRGGRGKSRSKSRSRYKTIECHYFHKTGHIQKNYFQWKRESKDK